jgi:hypothetical protein
VPGEWTAPTQPIPTKPAPYEKQGITADDLIDLTPELKAEAMKIIADYKLGPLEVELSASSSARRIRRDSGTTSFETVSTGLGDPLIGDFSLVWNGFPVRKPALLTVA